MTSLLNSIPDALEASDTPMSLRKLAQELAIEPSALRGMISFWVRKGRVRVNDSLACEPDGTCNCSSCGLEGCPFTVQVPTRYEIIR